MGLTEKIKSVIRPLYVDFFERRYEKKKNPAAFNNFDKNYKKIEKRFKNSEHKIPKIAFIINFAQCWNSLKTVYEEFVKRGYSTVIVCSEDDGKSGNKKSFDELSKVYKNVEFVNPDDSGFNLKAWEPDYVFYSRPYNNTLPKSLCSYSVAEYAKTCYIPYGFFVGNEEALMGIVYNENFMRSIGTVFASAEKEVCFIKKHNYGLKGKKHKVVFLGFPRFDLLPELPKEGSSKETYTVLWAPRWTVKNKENPTTDSSFLEYKDKLLARAKNVFKEEWIIRPHPKLFKNYAERGLITQDEIEEYLKKIAAMPNVFYDSEGDYYNSINRADVIFSDFTGLLMEYVLSGRPVVFFGNERAIESEELRKVVYVVNSFEQAVERLEKIEEGFDEKEGPRREFIIKARPDGNVCEKIADYVEKDYIKIKYKNKFQEKK